MMFLSIIMLVYTKENYPDREFGRSQVFAGLKVEDD